MNPAPCPSLAAYSAMRARAEKAEQLAAAYRDALALVHEAIAIPLPMTFGDGEVYDKILAKRTLHARTFLGALGDRDTDEVRWDIAYLRARLSEHPATGYRSWDETTGELAVQAGDHQ